MPAPAVIPAPIAYINAAAVKKLVVGSRVQTVRWPVFEMRQSCRFDEIGSTTHIKPELYEGGNGALQVGALVGTESDYA